MKLDNYYLAITLFITIAYQLFFFVIAFALKFDKLTDFAGGTNFLVIAIVTLSFSGVHHTRNVIASIFLMLWGFRLSAFLLFRILKTGTDTRFDTIRNHFFRFLGFWVFQMLWVWSCSLPITILNSPNIVRHVSPPHFGTAEDIIGTILFVTGLLIESVSDYQKYVFRAGPGAADRSLFMQSGLWRWSRHPNYFGDIMLHFGIWLVTISASTHGVGVGGRDLAVQVASVVGPLFLTGLLLFLSGLPLQEKPTAKRRYEKGERWEEYQVYLKRTSILVPMPRRVWERLPIAFKRTVGLEFSMYVFDPAKDSAKDLAKDSAKDPAKDSAKDSAVRSEEDRDRALRQDD